MDEFVSLLPKAAIALAMLGCMAFLVRFALGFADKRLRAFGDYDHDIKVVRDVDVKVMDEAQDAFESAFGATCGRRRYHTAEGIGFVLGVLFVVAVALEHTDLFVAACIVLAFALALVLVPMPFLWLLSNLDFVGRNPPGEVETAPYQLTSDFMAVAVGMFVSMVASLPLIMVAFGMTLDSLGPLDALLFLELIWSIIVSERFRKKFEQRMVIAIAASRK